jgi:hypothetical protein
MWDSPLYLEYAVRERIRDLASEAQRLSLETSSQPPRARGLRRVLARGLIFLGLHLDPQLRRPAPITSQPRLAPQEPKTAGAPARARLDVHQ